MKTKPLSSTKSKTAWYRKQSFATERANEILNQNDMKPDYREVLEFAVRFNTRQYRSRGEALPVSVYNAVVRASTTIIMAGQAKNVSPNILKRMIATSHRDRSYQDWEPEIALEKKYSLMAGIKPAKAKDKL